jgi:hypothetical protein
MDPGFSPSETATFIYSLKQPRANILKNLAGDPVARMSMRLTLGGQTNGHADRYRNTIRTVV